MTAANPTAPDTIVLVHGFWMTPRSWEKWVEHYEGKGYRVLTPIYPGFEGGSRRCARTPPRSKL
jgi:pimeloyl-ACP methyl ester carboxylesterase